MRRVVDIGRRIELVPMDPHFNDISIGLYRQNANHGNNTPVFLVHTYSHTSGATIELQRGRSDASAWWNVEKCRRAAAFSV